MKLEEIKKELDQLNIDDIENCFSISKIINLLMTILQ